MARILIPLLGSAGDVHPQIGIARELGKRGHRSIFIANDRFRDSCLTASSDFISLGSTQQYEDDINDPALLHPSRSVKHLAQKTLAQLVPIYQHLQQLYRPGETIIVASPLIFAARIAQEALGAPLVTILAQPLWLRSLDARPKTHLPVPKGLPKIVYRLIYRIVDATVIDRLLAEPLNQFRKGLGLEPVKRLFHAWCFSPQCTVGLWPSWFAPPQKDWIPDVSLTGFIHFDTDASATPSPTWSSILDRGKRTVVFTTGTWVKHAPEFFSVSAEVCQQLDIRGILLTRYAEQLPSPLPKDVHHFAYVPFGELLPQAAAIVHHGGINTVAQSLQAGIPQLISPFPIFDQPHNAHLVRELGVGYALPRKEYTVPRAADSLSSLLSSADVQAACQRYATLLQTDGDSGLLETCDLVERLIDKHSV